MLEVRTDEGTAWCFRSRLSPWSIQVTVCWIQQVVYDGVGGFCGVSQVYGLGGFCGATQGRKLGPR